VAVAGITASGLLACVHRAGTPVRRLRCEAFLEPLTGAAPVPPFDLLVAGTRARPWEQFAAAWTPVSGHDLLVAATALAHGWAALTDAPRDVARESGQLVRHPGQ
jgi:predicted nucleic acid-binding protein